MQVCKKGVWDESIPGVEFDDNGVSNFCHLQEHMMKSYPRGEQGARDWITLINKIKSAGTGNQYDCIIGVSGGVDSSYLLHLAKLHGLRPLAVTLDNGFSTKIAVSNIFKITDILNIDLETYVVDYEEIKELLKVYMKASLPWIDAPTDLAIKAVMYKFALQENVKYILRGNDFRSEGKQPKEWTYSDAKQLRFLHKKFGSGIKLKTYPMLNIFRMVYSGLIKKIKDVRPFYYLDYNKQEAKIFLTEEYGWEDYGGHHHENLFTKFAIAYWLPLKFGIDKRKINLSAQILSGAISRKDAIYDLRNPTATQQELKESRDYTIKKLDMSEAEFTRVWNQENRSPFDFPSQYDTIYKWVDFIKPVISKLYDYTPMSVSARAFIETKKKSK